MPKISMYHISIGLSLFMRSKFSSLIMLCLFIICTNFISVVLWTSVLVDEILTQCSLLQEEDAYWFGVPGLIRFKIRGQQGLIWVFSHICLQIIYIYIYICGSVFIFFSSLGYSQGDLLSSLCVRRLTVRFHSKIFS